MSIRRRSDRLGARRRAHRPILVLVSLMGVLALLLTGLTALDLGASEHDLGPAAAAWAQAEPDQPETDGPRELPDRSVTHPHAVPAHARVLKAFDRLTPVMPSVRPHPMDVRGFGIDAQLHAVSRHATARICALLQIFLC